MNEKILFELGFTPGEVKVYLSLLKLGNVTSGPIIKSSGISKSNVYEILDKLIKKGIVSEIKDENMKKFQATNPEKLLDIYNEKQNKLNSVKKALDQTIPELKTIYNSIKEKQEVTVFKGDKGLKSVFQGMINLLEKDDELIVFVAVEPPEFFKPFLIELENERIKKKIINKIIFNKNVPRTYINLSKKRKYTQAKTIFPEFDTPAVFNLYKNKTAILLWSKNPIAIVIENEEITKSFKKYFDVLWKIAKS